VNGAVGHHVTSPEDGSATTPETSSRSRVVPSWVAAALAVALMVSLVACGLLWKASNDHQRDATDRAALIQAGIDAQAAAERAATAMTTYDYRTVEEDFAWVDTAATPAFQEKFSKIAQPSIDLITSLQSSATGQVVDSGVEVIDATHVKVVLFVDQRITGQEEGTSAPDQPRITMQMVRQGGLWLVNEVELKSYVVDR